MKDLETLKKAWALLGEKERRGSIFVVLLLLLASAASAAMVGSVFPFMTVIADPSSIEKKTALTWAYDELAFTSPEQFLFALGAGAILVILLANAVQLLRAYVLARFTTMLAHSQSMRLFSHYLQQPYEFFLNRHTGNMSTNVLAEAGEAVARFYRPATDLLSSLLTILGVVALLVWVNPLIAIVTFLALSGAYAASYLFSRNYLRRIGRERAQANESRYRVTNETFGGIKEVKLFGLESVYLNALESPSRLIAKTGVWARVLSDLPRYVVQSVALCGAIVLCLILISWQKEEPGNAFSGIAPLLGVFALAGLRIMPELHKFYASLMSLQYGAASIERIYSDLEGMKPSEPPASAHIPRLGLRKELVLDGVTFSYSGTEKAGINGIDLTVRAGERVGIVGPTGAGKTTLVDVLLGLLNLQSGAIFVDGIAIDEQNLRSWQRSIAYVPQEIFLTDATLAQNIAFGVPPSEIDMEKVKRSAEISQLDDFVQSELPDGLMTFVGERGVRLSGGQRQRVGIARALYREADLIVFDEATNALDNLTEQQVMNALEGIPHSKTIIMIAHRLSTVKSCDKIALLESGEISALGTWDDLIAKSELFRVLESATGAP